VKGIHEIWEHFEWKNHSLFEKYPLQTKWRSICILWNKTICVRLGVSCTLLLRRIELSFERNTVYLSGFSSVRNISFLQYSSIQVNWGSTVSLGRKPSMLEEGRCSTLFSCENWVSMWKEYMRSESVLSGRIIHFLKNTLFRQNEEAPISYGTKQSVLD
jgi:hypothetical protein